MFCTYCSEENSNNAAFCTNCGRRLEKEMHTPPAGIIAAPGEGMSNGQASAEQVTEVRESSPTGRDITLHATFPASPSSLPPASISSPGGQSSIAVLDRVSPSVQQFFKAQANVPTSAFPIQQAPSSERFGSPSDQQSFLSGEALPLMPSIPTSVPRYNVATLLSQTSVTSPPMSSPPSRGGPPITSPPAKRFRGKLPKHWRIMALIALIILLVGGSASLLIPWLHTVLPAATATVTITPASQHLTKTYAINAVTGTPDASQHQVQARLLSFSTKAQAKTVKATGKGHQDATFAHGTLTYSGASGTETIPAGTNIVGTSGVKLALTVPATIEPGKTSTVQAMAVNSGSSSNIAAYDIDGHYYWTGNSNITYYVQNTQAFTDGQDAYDYTFVQQSDIDGAAAPLVNQLTSDAQSAVQKQLRTNEQFASTPECSPTTKANHKADDRATDATVTVTVTCKGVVYDQQAARSMTADWLRSDAASQLDNHYALVGDMVIGTPVVVTTDDTNGTVSLNVNTEGIWAYQFSDAQKQQIAQLVTGKPLADAQGLLQEQTGIKKVGITTADGWGTALSTSPGDIKLIVLSVPGLQATPAS